MDTLPKPRKPRIIPPVASTAPDSAQTQEVAVTHTEIIAQNLSKLNLPQEAVQFLLGLWGVSHVFDDMADGDQPDRGELDRALWFVLVGMPLNGFYRDNQAGLLPVVATAVLKWQASDKAERDGKADERSFGWRAGFYDVVLTVVCLVHGPDVATANAAMILGMYGEAYSDYIGEFHA